ncbi:MAG: site-2 protease family protein [Candidatus Binataceae bacterium]|nr:site-2 protease family protein [Candidatus Binataceae bacterium]
MDNSGTYRETSPILTELPRFEGPSEAVAAWRPAPRPWSIPRLNLALFLLTFLTTTMAGADTAGAPVTLFAPLQSLINLGAGLSFSIPLMAILLAHEMGHYLNARRHGVDATLPYFVPAPFPSIFFIGTFGAFIRMKSPARTRGAMLDIGAAGPWAGFAVALLAVIVGLKYSAVRPLDNATGGIELGNSMLFWGVSRAVLGVDPNSVNVDLSPIALAGWFGLLLTSINLLPVGQLDGGHTVYALFGGRGHRIISRLTWLGTALMVVVPYALGYEFWLGWLLWFALVFILGLGHPAAIDGDTPLSGKRRWMAWATVALFIVTFSPVPITLEPGSPQPPSPPRQQPQDPSSGPGVSVMNHGPGQRAGRLDGHVYTLRV